MEDVELNGPFAVPAHVLLQQLPDHGLLLLDLTSEEYFGLDEVGTAMYEAILAAGSLDGACDSLLGEYDIDRGTLLKDMRSFVDALLERGLIVQQPG